MTMNCGTIDALLDELTSLASEERRGNAAEQERPWIQNLSAWSYDALPLLRAHGEKPTHPVLLPIPLVSPSSCIVMQDHPREDNKYDHGGVSFALSIENVRVIFLSMPSICVTSKAKYATCVN
jgi:hypothetical protein